jgi:hypothetical protein
MYLASDIDRYRVNFTRNADLLPDDLLVAKDKGPLGRRLRVVFVAPQTGRIAVQREGSSERPIDTDVNLFAAGYQAFRKYETPLEPSEPGVAPLAGPEQAFRRYSKIQRQLEEQVEPIANPFEKRRLFEALRLMAREFRETKDLYYSINITPAETMTRMSRLLSSVNRVLADTKLMARGL